MRSLLELPTVQRIRRWGALRALRTLHRTTHRLPIKLRPVEKGRVLVVAPHMDDEVIGPGGTMALHRDLGSHVEVVFCAKGATPEADQTRRSEARACAELMRFSELRFLDHPEGDLSSHEPDMARGIADAIRAVAPDQIFCPFPSDHHRDHTAVAVAVATALERTGWKGEVWCYEVWSLLWPNVAVDISEVVDVKREAIAKHASQIEGLHYVDGALGLNRYRALRVYVPYAEAFFVGTPGEYRAVAEVMNRF